MNTLPPEILHQILLSVQQIDKPSLPTCRLVCRSFEHLTFPLLFHHIPHWLNYEKSHRAVQSLAQDVCNRPMVMWSPWASEPDGPVDDVWLGIVWRLLMRRNFVTGVLAGGRVGREEGSEGIGEGGEVLTAENFARLSGREEICEKRLRTAQNRFLLHRRYSEECAGEEYWGGGRF